MFYRIMLSLVLVLALFSCSKDKTSPAPEAPAIEATAPHAQTSAPADVPAKTEGSMTIEIVPETAYANSTIMLRANGFEPPQPGGEDRVVWYINGSPVSTADPTRFMLGEHLASVGDIVQAAAIIGGKQIYSNSIRVINHPPKITGYHIYDTRDESGNMGLAVNAEDPDGDTVSIEYEWTVNGLPAGTSEVLDMPPLPNDMVTVKARAYDGLEYSDEISHEFEVLGRAPRFERVMDYYMVGATYIYNASASDPDREPITFSLVNSPAGMAVDPESGQVRWDVPPGFIGEIDYIIVATDPKGQNGILPMKFSVSRDR